ncbi:MAG: hypothetical protein F6K03_00595 [Kamptonema sp. SIO4C4]|nr:hypothetical protein [Kamptonema sp. SIO4C4]
MNTRNWQEEDKLLQTWQNKIRVADRNNIFCHCRNCGEEWVTSERNPSCICGSENIEAIACWQFPDG